MTRTARPMQIVVILIAAALVVAGALTVGLAQTLTLLALVATVAVFYLMIHISLT